MIHKIRLPFLDVVVHRLPGRLGVVRLQGVDQELEEAGIGLNGAILISPALEITPLNPTDYDVLGWIDRVPTMAAAAFHHGRSRAFRKGTSLDKVFRDSEEFATADYTACPLVARVDRNGNDGQVEVHLHEPATGEEFLRWLVTSGARVDSFERMSTPLDEIFVKVAERAAVR